MGFLFGPQLENPCFGHKPKARVATRYHRSRTSTIVPKNSSRLLPKLRRLPWTNSIPKIVNDEYFWTEEERSRNSERKVRSNGYKVKLNIEENHYILQIMP